MKLYPLVATFPVPPYWWWEVASTDDRALNVRVAELAGLRRIFVNVADDTELSSFQVPTVIDRSPLVVAISSGGAAPPLLIFGEVAALAERLAWFGARPLGGAAAPRPRLRPSRAAQLASTPVRRRA